MKKIFFIHIFYILVLNFSSGYSDNTKPQPTLHVYNWAHYITPEALKKFETSTSIKVKYNVYDSNETLEAKLLAGNSGYDLVFPTATHSLPSLIQANVFQALDKSKLPNYKHLDTEILKKTALFDKGNAYTVPYLWSVTGLGYEAKKVKEILPNTPIDSWKILFDLNVLPKLKTCDISWLDEPDDMFPISARSIGKDPYSLSPEDVAASYENLQKARPYVTKIHSGQYISDLVNGDVCMAIGWSGDFHIAQRRAKAAKKDIDIRFIIPKEGAVMSVDSMAIPKDAPNPELAYKFMNFLLEPEVIADITNKTHYPSANKTAKQFVDKKLLNNPVVYPSAEDMQRITMDKPLPIKHRRNLMRRWTSILAMRQN